jgi:hypothetical protein
LPGKRRDVSIRGGTASRLSGSHGQRNGPKGAVLLAVGLHSPVGEHAADLNEAPPAVDVAALEPELFLRPEARPRREDGDGGAELFRDGFHVARRAHTP